MAVRGGILGVEWNHSVSDPKHLYHTIFSLDERDGEENGPPLYTNKSIKLGTHSNYLVHVPDYCNQIVHT